MEFRSFYAVLMLLLTVAWAAFCVVLTQRAVYSGIPLDILALAGASGLLGSMIVWLAQINHFYFRKKGEKNAR